MDLNIALESLSALSQETRLEAFRLLVRHAPDGLPAGAISQDLGVVQNTMSAHLAILARSGLVSSRRKGRVIEYTADFAAIRALLAFLMRDCCQGAPEICAPLLELASCEPHREESRHGETSGI